MSLLKKIKHTFKRFTSRNALKGYFTGDLANKRSPLRRFIRSAKHGTSHLKTNMSKYTGGGSRSAYAVPTSTSAYDLASQNAYVYRPRPIATLLR